MTVKIQYENRKLNFWDSVLRWFDKERMPIIPHRVIRDAYNRLGPSVMICLTCEWESFIVALIRPKRTFKVNREIG